MICFSIKYQFIYYSSAEKIDKNVKTSSNKIKFDSMIIIA